MQHRTRVLKYSGGFAGLCSCGFTTTDFPAQYQAAEEINKHEISALRAEKVGAHTSNPDQLEIPTGRKPR